MKYREYLGRKYNRLTVIEHVSGNKFLFACDCGGQKVANLHNVVRGSTKSCGCIAVEIQLKADDDGAPRNLYNYKRYEARKRDLLWELPYQDWLSLVNKNCYYCGCSPSNEYTYIQRRLISSSCVFRYNGLDRVNNDVGYIPNNVVPCCITCNRAKNSMNFAEFKAWVKKVYSTIVEED